MKTILFCIDTDVERARKQVESITDLPFKQDQIRIVVYHVFRGKDEQADAEQLKSVIYVTETLEDAGYSVDVQQSSGDASRHILEKAESIEADMISLAGRNRSPTGKVLFGSVTQDVVLDTERTVLLSSLE